MTKKKGEDAIRIDGKQEASSLLAALDSATRERILSGIEKADPALAVTLKKGMVRFEQILALDSPSTLKLIQTFQNTLIALAMRGLGPNQEREFFSKLSARQGDAIREEQNAMGPQKKSDVEAAREKLLTRARELHESGIITLYPRT